MLRHLRRYGSKRKPANYPAEDCAPTCVRMSITAFLASAWSPEMNISGSPPDCAELTIFLAEMIFNALTTLPSGSKRCTVSPPESVCQTNSIGLPVLISSRLAALILITTLWANLAGFAIRIECSIAPFPQCAASPRTSPKCGGFFRSAD